MSYSPYRTTHRLPFDRPDAIDLDVVPVLAILWVASLIRCIYALSSGEMFGSEATLAALAVLLVPLMVFRRSRTPTPADP